MMPLHHQVATILTPTQRAAFHGLIESHTGIRLNTAQVRSLDELIAELIARSGEQVAPEQLYAAFARGEHADLFADFAARLTIGETHFFRIAPQIDVLRETVIPDLLRRRANERILNLWSAGCSTGEEPYTLAILLRELLTASDGWTLRLLATDLSAPALDLARRAIYREWSFRETPAWVRERYFTADGAMWRLHEAIRQMVRFERVNLIVEPFPLSLRGAAPHDLILCRNVTIYFSAAVTQRLYRRFAELLAPGGWLILGPSDPAPHESGLEPIYLTNAIVWRKPLAVAPRPVSPATPVSRTPSVRPSPPQKQAAVARTPRAEPKSDRSPEDQLAVIQSQVDRGELVAARGALGTLVHDTPLLVEAHRLLGLLALEAGDSVVAAESLRRATFLDPEDPLAQFGLGRAYRALGDSTRAGAAFRQARRVLAYLAPDGIVPGDDSLSVDKLRRAIAAQLTTIDGVESKAR